MSGRSNTLHIWGNRDSMNLNPMILTNIQASNYFKKDLYELKTYHEVVDEIYYRVKHLEPWEKGSRKTHGLHGMCGGVRGVGGGGIVSTAYCILYKLYTLKLTRKQVIGLQNHSDSPYIRGLGFMYVRYTQAPQDLFDWFDEYLEDEEEIDVKAGGGCVMTIGQMLRSWLTRLEWFDTLYPRIPVPIQNEIMHRLRARFGDRFNHEDDNPRAHSNNIIPRRTPPQSLAHNETSREKSRSRSRSRERRHRRHNYHERSRSRSTDDRHHNPKRDRSIDKYRLSRSRSNSRDDAFKRREFDT